MYFPSWANARAKPNSQVHFGLCYTRKQFCCFTKDFLSWKNLGQKIWSEIFLVQSSKFWIKKLRGLQQHEIELGQQFRSRGRYYRFGTGLLGIMIYETYETWYRGYGRMRGELILSRTGLIQQLFWLFIIFFLSNAYTSLTPCKANTIEYWRKKSI